jgi:uncharacterized membrane protein
MKVCVLSRAETQKWTIFFIIYLKISTIIKKHVFFVKT